MQAVSPSARPLSFVLCLVCACALGVEAPAQLDAVTDAQVGPDSEPPHDAGVSERGAPLRVGSFNVRRLGLEADKDLAHIAGIIDRSFDVLGLLEVMQTNAGGHPGLDALMAVLPAGFSVLVTSTPRPRVRSPYSEHYALLYRTQRVQPCGDTTGLVYVPDDDGSASGSGSDHFTREPAFACLRVVSPTAAGRNELDTFDFVMALYHARWGTGEAIVIAREAAHLDDAFAAMARAHPDERDIFMMGDFNLTKDVLARHTTAGVRTNGQGSTLGPTSEPTSNLYDHLLVPRDADLSELVSQAWVLDVRGSDPRAYRRSISDHLPIIALLRADVADDD